MGWFNQTMINEPIRHRMGVKVEHIKTGRIGIVCGIWLNEGQRTLRVIGVDGVFQTAHETEFKYKGILPNTSLMERTLKLWNLRRRLDRLPELTLENAFRL